MTVERIPKLTGCCRHLAAKCFWVSSTSLWIDAFAAHDYGDSWTISNWWRSGSLAFPERVSLSQVIRSKVWGKGDWETHRWMLARSYVPSNSDPQLLLPLAQSIKTLLLTTSFPNFCPNFQLGRNQSKLSNLYRTNYIGCPISTEPFVSSITLWHSPGCLWVSVKWWRWPYYSKLWINNLCLFSLGLSYLFPHLPFRYFPFEKFWLLVMKVSEHHPSHLEPR